MRQLTHKRLSAWLLTLIMLVGMLPAMASADEADDGLSPPAPQEDYGIGDDVPWLLCCYPNTEDVGILEFRLDGGDGAEVPENTLRFPDAGGTDAG